MTRRNIELALLLIASPIVLLLFAMICLNDGEALNFTTLSVPIGLMIAFLASHLAIRKLSPNADPAILPIVFALSGIGIAFITRIDADLASKQVIWLFVGVIAMVATLLLVKHLDKVAQYKYTLMIIGIILLLSPMLPVVGSEIYGSRIWLSIGGLSFQPGEIAKIFIVRFLAAYLSQNREMLSVFTVKVGPFHLPDMRTLLPLLIMWGISMIIVVGEKDLGSACVVFLVFLTMLYVATGKKSYVVFGVLLTGLGLVAAYFLFSHVQVRVETWLDPFADANGTGYQIVQSLFSMADGGMFGVGIGRGMAVQIPVVESDFIFACIAEEAGFLGASALLLLFLCLAIRGLVTAARAKSDISSLIAVGATAILVVQAFIIVGGVTKFIPLTGLTLPFVSQGGSSLLAGFILVALLLRAGDEGTGLGTEVTQSTSAISGFGVLGRVSLGKRITHVVVVACASFALLIANLTMVMIVQAEEYQNMPNNNHTIAQQAKTERGTISTSDGVILAQSVKDEETGYYTRKYPQGTFAANVVGYASDQYGTSGIESSCNDILLGKSNYANWSDYINAAAGISSSGNDVELTIDSTVQQAAESALEGYNGACVVLDPNTGAVLAMASSPTYNPNKIGKAMSQTDGESGLFNRATQALYIPGSTFKIVSLATALENDIADTNDEFKSPGSMEIGGEKVRNFDGNDYGTITLARATELSSNTVFGQLGTKIGADLLVKSSENFGLNQEIDFDLPVSTSLMPNPDEMTEWETAWSAIGQPVGQHESPAGPQVTVLQMAMVGAAIANEGTIMNPYLVKGIYDSTGTQSFAASSSKFGSPITPDTAKRVMKVLKGVVESGTGTAAAVSGTTIAGKTGTAETGKELDDTWFVGMGPTDNCSVVVAIVLEESGEGLAATRASSVLRAALKCQGDL